MRVTTATRKIKMSDNDSSAAEDTKRKRGRPAKGEVKESPAKEAKKRGRAPSEDKKEVKKTDGATPAKRGRGRPKGSTKRKGKAAAAAAKKPGNRGRGRPKKEDKKEESGGEEEEVDEDEEEEGED